MAACPYKNIFLPSFKVKLKTHVKQNNTNAAVILSFMMKYALYLVSSTCHPQSYLKNVHSRKNTSVNFSNKMTNYEFVVQHKVL